MAIVCDELLEPCFDLRRLPWVWANRTPDKTVIKEGPLSITYRELEQRVEALSRGMQAQGVKKGDRVVTALANWHEAIIVFFATVRLGAVFVPCNKFSAGREVRERVCLVKPSLVFVGRREYVDELENLDFVSSIVAVRLEDSRCIAFENLPVEPLDADTCCDPTSADDLAAIIFTSGSTGEPKGVELSCVSLALSAQNYGRAMEVSRDDVFAMAMPLNHMFGIDAGVVLPIEYGASIVLVDQFKSRQMLEIIENEKATVLYGSPTMFARELEAARKESFDLSSLRTGMMGGARCSAALIESVREELHCNVVIGYGSTEAGAISATSLKDPAWVRATTVGRPFDNVDVRVVGDDGILRNEGRGELINRSESVMRGFYLQPDRTQAALKDGWIHTGDLVEIGEDGLIRIIGRIDDMINRGGYKIFGSEIEHVYDEHPLILECCVVPIEDEELGQRTCLAVKPTGSGEETDPNALREYARGRIAKHKIPDYVIVFEELPKLSIGKFDKQKIRVQCTERINASHGVSRGEIPA